MRKIFALWGYIGLSTLFSAGCQYPYGYDLDALNAIDSVNIRKEKRIFGISAYNDDDLIESYVYPYVVEFSRAIRGESSDPSGGVNKPPEISNEDAAFFAELEDHLQTLIDAIEQLPVETSDEQPVTETDLSALEEKCIKIADSLSVPQKLCSSFKETIRNAFQNGRVCTDPEGSDQLASFREKYLLPRPMSGYSFNGEFVVAAETYIDVLSAVFNKCGGAIAEQWLNCGNQNDCFSLFFQIEALFSAVKQKIVTKDEACKMARDFLIIPLAGLKTAVANKKICTDGLFNQKKSLNFAKYADFLWEGLERAKLTGRERKKVIHQIVSGIQAFQANPSKYIRGDYAIAAIFSLIEYVNLEKTLRSVRSEEDKEQVVLLHLTRVKLMHEKPELWKKHLCGDKKAEVKEALDFLIQEIKNLSNEKDAAPKAKPEIKEKEKEKIKVKAKGNVRIKSKKTAGRKS
jgi:hypothetical protein